MRDFSINDKNKIDFEKVEKVEIRSVKTLFDVNKLPVQEDLLSLFS